MFTGKDGYILIDALISCIVLSVTASVCLAAMTSHYQVKETIRQQAEENEEQWSQYYQSIPACLICTEEEEADSY